MVREEAIVDVRIPAGVHEGMQLSIQGEGNAGPNGGVPGDLLVVIEEVPHEHLQRNGKNLHFDLYIPFTDAALGASAEVPLVSGKAKIKVDPGTQSGRIVRLRGKGLPAVDSYGNGDLLVNINVWTPQKLSSDERAILEKLRDSANFQPAADHQERGFFDKVRDMFA
jgi:molecular chaperone DnaJ